VLLGRQFTDRYQRAGDDWRADERGVFGLRGLLEQQRAVA
jgi:hypothetical protein